MPTNPLPTESAQQFLRTVLRSGLLSQDELQSALRSVPQDRRSDPKALAEHLIKGGKLSRFQATKLLGGAALGLVLGPFQVLAPIGKGGMGTVYLARDGRSGQLLALKVLSPKRAREEERILARFRREMEMCHRVAHPHIVYTYEVDVHQGVHYIAMEYIPGRTLLREVNEKGPLEVPRAARLFAEVASALDHAHSQGIIHRDLKPSNIMLTPHDHTKLLDFGLALIEGEKGVAREIIGGAGYVVGTMDYIAPEQTLDAARVDARSDIYALGCTLYHALAGRPPFPGGTNPEKMARHRSEPPAPIAELNEKVPIWFAALVHRMMAKNPDDRYPSAHALRDELLPWASAEAALPLDRPDDQEYQEAVAGLEAAEPSEGQVEEVIPLGILEPEPAGKGRTKAIATDPTTDKAPPPTQPVLSRNLVLYLMISGATVLLLAGIGCLGLLLFLFGR